MQSIDMANVLRPTAQAYTLPPACYADPAILAHEQAQLFVGGWVSAGRGDSLDKVGDYLAFSVSDTPLIAVRGDDSQLRVFANTCRHRGMRLIEPGRGSCRHLVCPFHGWRYTLEGVLAAAPRMQGAENFDPADFGLVQVPCAQRSGFLFVNVDGNAGPIDDWLGDFDALHQPWGLESLVTASTREFSVACNWKSFLEVFNEYYHLRKVHPGTFSALYDEPDVPEDARGAFVSQFGVHRHVGSVGVLEQSSSPLPVLPGLSGRLANGTRYTWVYPGLAFAASRDAVWIFEVTPHAVAETGVRLTLLFDPHSVATGDFEAILGRYEHRMAVGMDEDIAILEAQQLGLTSALARPGRFCPELEPSIHAFHRWYAGRLVGAGLAHG